MSLFWGKTLGRKNLISFRDCPGLGTSSITSLQFTIRLSPGNQEGQSRCIFYLTWSHQHVSLSYLTQCLFYLTLTFKKETNTLHKNDQGNRSKIKTLQEGTALEFTRQLRLQNQLAWNSKEDKYFQADMKHECLLTWGGCWVPGKQSARTVNKLLVWTSMSVD